MLDRDKVIALYRENLDMAIEDGHTEESERIAWEWTEEKIINLFVRIMGQHRAGVQDAINKAYFG